MTAPLSLAVHTSRHLARLVLAGELDTAGAAQLEDAFRQLASVHGAASVEIELGALEFCDSGGWHALERCRDEGATLVGSPPCLRRLLYLIQHAHLLPPEMHELRGLESRTPHVLRQTVEAGVDSQAA
jgi:ABC-type transporter Mla MlaB component